MTGNEKFLQTEQGKAWKEFLRNPSALNAIKLNRQMSQKPSQYNYGIPEYPEVEDEALLEEVGKEIEKEIGEEIEQGVE